MQLGVVRPFGSFGQAQLATPGPPGVTTKQCSYRNVIIIKHVTIVYVIFLFIEYKSDLHRRHDINTCRSLNLSFVNIIPIILSKHSGLAEWSRHCGLDSTWSIVRSNKKHINKNQAVTYAALLAL